MSTLSRLEKHNLNFDSEELHTFFSCYLDDHTYFNVKSVSKEFLLNILNIKNRDNEYYYKQIKSISSRLSHMIHSLVKSGEIEKYNERSYKVVKKERKERLENMRYWDLYKFAKENELRGFSMLNKEELIQFIIESI